MCSMSSYRNGPWKCGDYVCPKDETCEAVRRNHAEAAWLVHALEVEHLSTRTPTRSRTVCPTDRGRRRRRRVMRSRCDDVSLDHRLPNEVKDVVEAVREHFNGERDISVRRTIDDETGQVVWFVEVEGDISSDSDWSRLVDFPRREIDGGIHVVFGPGVL